MSVLARIKTLVWNGPLGAFEMPPFDNGNRRGRRSRGGTDRGRQARLGRRRRRHGGGAERGRRRPSDFTYVSTAGGAFLEWMEGKALPGVEVLRV